MTTRKMSYTKSCKIVETCGRLKFQKLIPEGNLLNLSCGISERLLLMIKACSASIYFILISKLYRYCGAMYGFVLGLGLVIAKRDFCFETKTRPSLSYKVSRGKTETFAFTTRVESKTFIQRTRVKSKTFFKRTRVDSRPETLVSRSQVWC